MRRTKISAKTHSPKQTKRFFSGLHVNYSKFYSKANPLYWKIWSSEGFIHPGIFGAKDDLPKAIENTNRWLLKSLKMDASQSAIELGCGNGSFAFWLNQELNGNLNITCVDFSEVPLKNGEDKKKELGSRASGIQFKKASIIELQNHFPPSSFTRAYSSSVLCHILEREKALLNIHYVLKKDGLFVFDDFITSQEGKQTTSLQFPPLWTIEQYSKHLRSLGFHIHAIENHSQDMKRTYECLRDNTALVLENDQTLEAEQRKLLQSLHTAYAGSVKDITQGLLSWVLCICEKSN